MTNRFDAIVIGGGVNGLTCAALLAKGGVRTALVERHDTLGGCAIERELAPGFHVPTLAHATGPVRRDVVESLQLLTHGLRFAPAPIEVSSLSPDGRPLTIWHDTAKTAEGLRAWSPADADAWPAFRHSLSTVASVIGSLFTRTPPSVDDPGARDAWALVRTFAAFRGMARDDQWRLLRWGPMAVADLVSEACETELLRAPLAADGIFGAMLGPWSAGSGMQMLLAAANRALAPAGGHEVVGGPAGLARALAGAAERWGVEIRAGQAVSSIDVHDDRASGVTLANGDRLEASTVISALDPKRTFLSLCNADHLPPEFLWRIGNYRTRGTLAKVNLALSALPSFGAATATMLAARVRLAPGLDFIEQAFDHAKYGRYSPHPWVEFTIPSLTDPSMAPEGAHVLSAYAQFAPYDLRREPFDSAQGRPGDGRRESSNWDDEREALGETVIATLEQYSPGLRSLIVGREVITPLDLERQWGLTGGHIFHGELALDQFFAMRPLLGSGRYRTPLRGLYLCGSGTHPGTGLTGGSGANAAREVARDIR